MALELFFLKPDNIDEIAQKTGKSRTYLEGLLHANNGKTVNIQVNTYDIPEGWARS